MTRENHPEEKTAVWMTCAAAPLIVSGAGRTDWLLILGAGLLNLVILRILPEKREGAPKGYWLLQWIWCQILMGMVLRKSNDCWETGPGEKLWIPLSLFALLLISKKKGTDRKSVMTVLLRITAGSYIPILLFGLSNIHPGRIQTGLTHWDPALLLGLMLPWTLWNLTGPGSEEKRRRNLQLVFLGVICAWITAGMLSYAVAERYENGFYQAVRGIRVGRATEKFEPLLSVSMTLGWFAALCYLEELAFWARKEISTGPEKILQVIGWILPLAAGWFWQDRRNGEAVLITALLWGILPAFLRLKRNFRKKEENS